MLESCSTREEDFAAMTTIRIEIPNKCANKKTEGKIRLFNVLKLFEHFSNFLMLHEILQVLSKKLLKI
jgi:hypothetical protein